MKNLKNLKHEKEFDTKTLFSEIDTNTDEPETQNSKDTKEAVTLKDLAQSQAENVKGKETLVYEPRPLTPDDDIYEEIIEQFATAPTKPKYWFEEFGDYWSCSCGHINKGNSCKSCGLERELLRSLFILHKPADAPGKLNKKLKTAKDKVDEEEKLHSDKENRRKQREATSNGTLQVIPIENDSSESNNSIEVIEKESEENVTTALSEVPKSNQLPVKVADTPKRPQNSAKRIKIIIAIVVCLILIAGAGTAIYYYFAAPAIEYEEAQKLQEAGKYEAAIAKYEALGDYEDSKELIWECYCSIGDSYFDAGEFNDAIDTYKFALELKDSKELHSKIRECYIEIGDGYVASGKFKKALETYAIAVEMRNSGNLQDKINKAKFGYVKANLDDGSSKAVSYMNELMDLNYPGIQKIYDEYYAWHINIIANTSENDLENDLDVASRKDTVYFHVFLSGGEPNEEIQLYYEISWPNGSNQIYDLDSTWKDGSKITAGFQYPIPLFGKEGQLTFNLYDKNTQELLGSDQITFQK